jgi:histidine triad (HIT) family protein
MPTLFTRIIDAEIPGTFVWRDPEAVAFLSINPLRRGHVLVVPRLEVDHWLDCPPELWNHLMSVASTLGRALQSAYEPTRIGLMVAGLEVPHLHVHLVPIDDVGDLDFSNARPAERDELEREAVRIREALAALGATGVAD